MILSKQDALHAANVFSDFFGNFGRIDEYQRSIKMERMESFPAALPGTVSYTHLTLPTKA